MTRTSQIRSAKAQRLQRRLVRHYLPLVLISALLMGAVDQVLHHGNGLLERLVVASAYLALALIGVTLLLGPLNLLRRRPSPASSDLRRDVGIWAGLVGIAHMLLGLQWHYPWEPWMFFWDGGPIPFRFDRFGQASFLGLGGILIVGVLLTISNDRAFRTLGHPRWKALQRLNYGLIGIITIHAILFILEDDRDGRYLLIVGGIVGVVAIGQLMGLIQHLRSQSRAGQGSRAALAHNIQGDAEEAS